MDKIKKALITAGCVSLGSQIYINVFSEDFIIALAVVIFGICLRIFPEINPLKLSILTGICSPVFRFLIMWMDTDELARSAKVALPDMIFYFCFGIIFYFLYYKTKDRSYTFFWIVLVLCDTLSNNAEIAYMNGIGYLTPTVVGTLFIVGMIRSTLIVGVCLIIDSYKLLLEKEEHEQRYKALMVMASIFNSEVYYMKKSIIEIEDVMKKAFSLYRTVENGDYPEELQTFTLDIAKDVHEIKKGYLRVIKGLEDNFLLDIKVTKLKIREFIEILETDIEELMRRRNRKIRFVTKINCDFVVTDHYMLMSIIRNIVVNGVDAIPVERDGVVNLYITRIEENDEEFINFSITDNGMGIKEDDMVIIFEPGYSTKFDENTGNINRGLGLTLVKNLVEERFKGRLLVESKEGSYTTFNVLIPIGNFEEN
ncbi:MAG: sensor histidine kinase [Aminipila sp.]